MRACTFVVGERWAREAGLQPNLLLEPRALALEELALLLPRRTRIRQGMLTAAAPREAVSAGLASATITADRLASLTLGVAWAPAKLLAASLGISDT